MKKMQRILSILLVLTLILSVRAPAMATEEDGVKLSMAVSQTNVSVGKTVSLTIQADQDFTTRGSGMTIYYDDTVLELVPAGTTAAAPLTINGPLRVNGKTAFRISFPPGLEPASFCASEPLAVVQFKALTASEQTGITMGAAYLYDDLLTEVPVTIPTAVNVEVIMPVTGVTLDMEKLTLEEGKMAALKATVTPAGASDPSVIWTSFDETVAIVSDGVVKAISAGQTTITATTTDGGFAASCTLTVTPPYAGYTVKMPEDTTAVVGEIIQIPVVIGNTDGKTGYNALDLDFTYDPLILKLTSTQLTGFTVTAAEGKINVLGYGPDRTVDSVPFTLLFEVQKMGETQITVTSANVDNSGNVAASNASLATRIKESTVISVSGYPVTLPEGFKGEDTAKPNEDYTFREPDDCFDYTLTATVGGETVEVTDNGDGSYTIPAELVTGEIVITATRTGKIFDVTLGADMLGNAAAQHSVDYTATLLKDENYSYCVTVTVGGNEYTGYAVFDDSYVIPGADITGDIVFTVVKQYIGPDDPTEPTDPGDPSNPTDPTDPSDPNNPTDPSDPTDPSTPADPTDPGDTIPPPTTPVTMHSVTFTGSGAGAAQGNATSIAHGSTYTLTLKKETGYSYQVSCIMGGKPAVNVSPNANGTYTIANVIAPLQIVIEKSLQTQISVNEYLTLDEKTMFLIQVTGSLDSGKVFTFAGNPMYYSEAYETWVYLWITQEEFSAASAGQKVATATAETKTLEYSSGDVNLSGTVNVVDAKLISDLYNGIYEDFLTVNMIKFLNADIIRDKKLDVRDVAAVIYSIVSSKEG